MVISSEKKAANRRNALLSTGPRTVEGKARSRRNGLKHGLTGEGLVLPDEDVEAVKARFARLKIDMKPRTELGLTIVERIATLSVKMHRSSEHEASCLSELVRTAPVRFDNDRFTEVERLLYSINEDPHTHCRRLDETPEGVKIMLDAWKSIKADLDETERDLWNNGHYAYVENLMSRKPGELPASRVQALHEAMFGSFRLLKPDEVLGLSDEAKKVWARQQLSEFLADKIDKFTRYLAKMDLDGIAQARVESKKRAKFDPSKEAILARKYEAANAREFYKAIDKFYEVEDRARIAHEEEEDDATPEPIETSEPVASPLTEPITHPRRSVPADPLTAENQVIDMNVDKNGRSEHGISRDSRPFLTIFEPFAGPLTDCYKSLGKSARGAEDLGWD